MHILIRADSSSQIGTGHIMRDLVLAKRLQSQYPNAVIRFVVRPLEGNINHKIIQEGYEIISLGSSNMKELQKVLKKYKPDMLVIDNYDIGYQEEKRLKRSHKSMKLLVVDDTYEKHYCDILLNHNISAEAKKYTKRVPKQCTIQCGAKYTLLRDEFYKEKKKYYKKSGKRVLVAMGGADTAKLNIKILKTLKQLPTKLHVDVVTTTANKNLKKLQKYAKNKKWIHLHIESNKIAKLMKKADLAIITPSVTLNEVDFMQVPYIAIQTAKNQKDVVRYLQKSHLRVLTKFSAEKLLKALKEGNYVH